MTNILPSKKSKNKRLKNKSYQYKEDFLIVGNQQSIDKFKEIDYLTDIFYKGLH